MHFIGIRMPMNHIVVADQVAGGPVCSATGLVAKARNDSRLQLQIGWGRSIVESRCVGISSVLVVYHSYFGRMPAGLHHHSLFTITCLVILLSAILLG